MKVVREYERKYYKYVETEFVQPVLTSNGTLGVDDIACYTNYASNWSEIYKIFSKSSEVCNAMGSPFANMEWILYSKNALCIKRFYGTFLNCTTLQLYGSNDNVNYTQIPFTYLGATQSSFDYSINNTQYFHYYKWLSGGQAYVSSVSTCPYGTKMKIDATQRIVQQTTPDDYDYYIDKPVYKLPKKIERKYYKYVESEFVQPVLTENGTWNNQDIMAVKSNPNAREGYPVFNAFDYNPDTICILNNPGQYASIYISNPNKLKLTSVTVTNYHNHYLSYGIQAFEVLGSNDETNWVSFGSTSIELSTGATATVNITDKNFYKYLQIKCTSSTTYGYQCTVSEIRLLGSQLMPTESTLSDYDYYIDIPIYYAINQ